MPWRHEILFDTPEEMESKIQEYFDTCKKAGRPYTMSGLALALGTNRMTLYNYEHWIKKRTMPLEYKDKFNSIIIWAKAVCENYAEEELFLNTNKNVAGIIFNMKNNYEWHNRDETEHLGSVTITTVTYGKGDSLQSAVDKNNGNKDTPQLDTREPSTTSPTEQGTV